MYNIATLIVPIKINIYLIQIFYDYNVTNYLFIIYKYILIIYWLKQNKILLNLNSLDIVFEI